MDELEIKDNLSDADEYYLEELDMEDSVIRPVRESLLEDNCLSHL